MVWPALFLEQRLFSFWAIGLGLAIEYPFVRRVTNLSVGWCAVADLAMNTCSSLIGILLIPLAGLGWELSLGLLINLVFHTGTFNLASWAATCVFSAAINAVIECAVLVYGFKQKPFKRIFMWLWLANGLSVAIAFVSMIAFPPRNM